MPDDNARRTKLQADLKEIRRSANNLALTIDATINGFVAAKRIVPAVLKTHLQSVKQFHADIKKLFDDATS